MDMKRILLAILLIVLVVSLTACANQSTDAPPQGSAEPSAPPETTLPPQTESPSAQEPEPYTPMDIFGAEFNLFGMDSPATVFEASFSKGAAKLEGKNPFTLSMTGEGNMYACIAYQADVAGLGLDDGGKMELLEEYLANDGFLEFTDKDGRTVTIRQADPNDDRYEYVEADGSHGASGGGCVIELTYYVPDADIEKYTELVRDNYDLNALSPIADYFDTATDFSECGVSVNLYKNEVQTSVVYYVPDAETIRQNIAANIESDWWEWYGNMETYIAYNDAIGNKLTFDSKGSAVTVEQTNNSFNSPPITDGSLTALGFGFDDAGTCGVYEDREPHYKSVAIARPEWGEHPDDWNIEFMDTDIKGYSLRITYHADDGRYHISVDKDGESCAYDCYPDKDEFGWEYPDIETVHRMFGDAFDSQGKELYYTALAYFEQYVQEHFGMSVDELYEAPKQ